MPLCALTSPLKALRLQPDSPRRAQVCAMPRKTGVGMPKIRRKVQAEQEELPDDSENEDGPVPCVCVTKPDMSTRTKGGWVFNGDQSVDTAADSRHLPCRDPRFATFRNCSRWPSTNRN